MKTRSLTPRLQPESPYPSDAVFMARTDLFETRMLGFYPLLLDTVTTLAAGLLRGRAAIRHEAGAGPEVMEVYTRAGIDPCEETYSYRTPMEAEQHANALISAGRRLVWPYPLPRGRYPETAHLVPTKLYRFLNAKSNLEALVPAEHVAKRHILSHNELDGFEPDGPVFLKAGGEAATGWGFAVHPCRDSSAFQKARDWFAERHDSVPFVIAEEYVELARCWCAGIAVDDAGTTCFGGAEQLFSSPAKQVGSLIDPENAFPAEGVALAIRIGEAARARGFLGIAGLDIGRALDGRLLVFDPNFRLNSSTSQLLFHDSASARSGLPVSLSFQVHPGGPFRVTASLLEAPITEGWFIPTRLFNGEKHPLSEGKHIVTGFVLGRDRADADQASDRLQARLLDP